MTIKYAAGDLLTAMYKSAGNVHMTTTHIIPLWYLFAGLAVIGFVIWAARRYGKSS